MACEVETTPVQYRIEVEFDDSGTPSTFGPISTRDRAEEVLNTLAGRTDVKKATLKKEAII